MFELKTAMDFLKIYLKTLKPALEVEDWKFSSRTYREQEGERRLFRNITVLCRTKTAPHAYRVFEDGKVIDNPDET